MKIKIEEIIEDYIHLRTALQKICSIGSNPSTEYGIEINGKGMINLVDKVWEISREALLYTSDISRGYKELSQEPNENLTRDNIKNPKYYSDNNNRDIYQNLKEALEKLRDEILDEQKKWGSYQSNSLIYKLIKIIDSFTEKEFRKNVCKHGIEIGKPCNQCPGTRKTAKPPNWENCDVHYHLEPDGRCTCWGE